MHRYELKDQIEQILGYVEMGSREEMSDLKRQRREACMDPWSALCCYKLDDSPEGDCDVSLVSIPLFAPSRSTDLGKQAF